MEIKRTKNAKKNIIFGVILKIYQILVPFLMRTAMIHILGIEYIGINSLVKSVLQVLNLAELGIGAAMVYSMYQPIVEDDEKKICKLMNLYKKYYRIIGLIVLASGLIITPFIKSLIKGTVPDDINIYIIYLLNLGATVLTYWLFAYKNSILQAFQRTDVISRITLICNSIMYGLQFLFLFIFKNYYIYVILLLFGQILINISTKIVADKMYPQFVASGKLEKEEVKGINQRIKDLFTAKVGSMIVLSSDSIIISAFLGLTTLAIYQNYYLIIYSLFQFLGVIFDSVMAGIGNSIIVETKEKNYNDLKKFTLLLLFIISIISCGLLCCFQNFIIIWIGKDYTLAYINVIFMAMYFFIYEINRLLTLYKDAAGIWHSDRFRPLIVAISNIILNIILVQKIELSGVLLSTVITELFIGMPWLIHNLFKEIFKRSSIEYLKKLGYYTILAVVSCLISYFASSLISGDNILTLILRGIISISIPSIIFIIFNIKLKEFKQAKTLVLNLVKR